MPSMAVRLKELQQTIERTARLETASAHFAAWRALLHYYQQASKHRWDPEPQNGEKDYEKLWTLAKEAMLNLGGQAEPALSTLAEYDHRRNGPMLGVSNEGSASAAIRQGALGSPKCMALRPQERTPLTIGVANDGERLGAVGEVAIGPDEYCDIRRACMGRILTTTNVGTRANIRYYLTPPVVKIARNRSSLPDQRRWCFAVAIGQQGAIQEVEGRALL
jgi:hypothetical protein